MWNFLLNLQSVCDSRKTDDMFVCFFLPSLCGRRRCWDGQILQCYSRQIGKSPYFFLSRKKRVNFSIELSLVQYIQVILNLHFKFYETLVEVTGNPETMRVWEMRRGEGLWARKTLSSTQRNIMCVTKMKKKTVKNIVAIILTTLHKNQNYLGNYLGNHFRKLGITITR